MRKCSFSFWVHPSRRSSVPIVPSFPNYPISQISNFPNASNFCNFLSCRHGALNLSRFPSFDCMCFVLTARDDSHCFSVPVRAIGLSSPSCPTSTYLICKCRHQCFKSGSNSGFSLKPTTIVPLILFHFALLVQHLRESNARLLLVPVSFQYSLCWLHHCSIVVHQ